MARRPSRPSVQFSEGGAIVRDLTVSSVVTEENDAGASVKSAAGGGDSATTPLGRLDRAISGPYGKNLSTGTIRTLFTDYLLETNMWTEACSASTNIVDNLKVL